MTEADAQRHPGERLIELVGADPAGPADPDLRRHLDRCETCRAELEILRALASPREQEGMSDLERRAAYAGFRQRTVKRSATGGAPFEQFRRPLTWAAAAAVAAVAGVWASGGGADVGPGTTWNPEPAMAGFEEDLRDLDASAAQVRLVLGDPADPANDPAADRPEWEELGEADLDRLRVPWEND